MMDDASICNSWSVLVKLYNVQLSEMISCHRKLACFHDVMMSNMGGYQLSIFFTPSWRGRMLGNNE